MTVAVPWPYPVSAFINLLTVSLCQSRLSPWTGDCVIVMVTACCKRVRPKREAPVDSRRGLFLYPLVGVWWSQNGEHPSGVFLYLYPLLGYGGFKTANIQVVYSFIPTPCWGMGDSKRRTSKWCIPLSLPLVGVWGIQNGEHPSGVFLYPYPLLGYGGFKTANIQVVYSFIPTPCWGMGDSKRRTSKWCIPLSLPLVGVWGIQNGEHPSGVFLYPYPLLGYGGFKTANIQVVYSFIPTPCWGMGDSKRRTSKWCIPLSLPLVGVWGIQNGEHPSGVFLYLYPLLGYGGFKTANIQVVYSFIPTPCWGMVDSKRRTSKWCIPLSLPLVGVWWIQNGEQPSGVFLYPYPLLGYGGFKTANIQVVYSFIHTPCWGMVDSKRRTSKWCIPLSLPLVGVWWIQNGEHPSGVFLYLYPLLGYGGFKTANNQVVYSFIPTPLLGYGGFKTANNQVVYSFISTPCWGMGDSKRRTTKWCIPLSLPLVGVWGIQNGEHPSGVFLYPYPLLGYGGFKTANNQVVYSNSFIPTPCLGMVDSKR